MGRMRNVWITRRARCVLRELDCVLDDVYGAPETILENKQDPLDEAIYIILSFQTDLDRFKCVWGQLRKAFPTWEDVAQAPIDSVQSIIRAGGLQGQKARIIKRLLQAVRDYSGSFSLDFLRDIEDGEAERILTHLPGLSWKAARCILLYSLDRAVFPVDGNTFRILKRVGVLPASSIYRRRALHDVLQKTVEPARRKSFHINMVIHGQRTCLPRNPRCCECVARRICMKRGVPSEIRPATGVEPQPLSGGNALTKAGEGGTGA